jgi:hypothetical protein
MAAGECRELLLQSDSKRVVDQRTGFREPFPIVSNSAAERALVCAFRANHLF